MPPEPAPIELESKTLKSWVKVTPTFASSYRAGPGWTELDDDEEDEDDDGVVDDVLPHAATPRAATPSVAHTALRFKDMCKPPFPLVRIELERGAA